MSLGSKASEYKLPRGTCWSHLLAKVPTSLPTTLDVANEFNGDTNDQHANLPSQLKTTVVLGCRVNLTNLHEFHPLHRYAFKLFI